MASLTEHVMINKLINGVSKSIKMVGGDVSNVSYPSDYATVIKDQLVRSNSTLSKEIILDGYSCIIESDEEGCDYYNTDYYAGVKQGLKPKTLYLRICPAVIDGSPIYIDLSRIMVENGFDAESLTEEDINNIIRDK